MKQAELDEIWANIGNGKYDDATHRPEQIPAEDGKNIMSIPNGDGTARRVYERKENESWQEVPFIGSTSQFE